MNELVDVSMYGLLGYLLLNSSTVQDLFNTLVRYHSVHHDAGIYYELLVQKNRAIVRIHHAEPTRVRHRHTTEWCLGFIPDYLESPLGDLARPLSAQFTYDAPRDLHQLNAYFGDNLEFNQTHNQLIYPRSILQERISDTNSGMLEILRNLADQHLLEQKKDSSLLKSIEIILLDNLSSKKCNATDVADVLNLSISTFKRRMAREGIDFKKTKDSMKNEIARQLLLQTNATISEIAQKTGFSNQSGFTRFFIRCNQQRPLNYRKSKAAHP